MLVHGDARHIPLADETVQCVVTSPPYWGLRDYGLTTWEGGDAECDHKPPDSKKGNYPDSDRKQQTSQGSFQYREWSVCGKCGAIRRDRGIGLEASLDEYITNIVGVFREVWRVLRTDGTVFLNLGDAYAGSGGAHSNDKNPGLSKSFYRGGAPGQKNSGLKPKDLLGLPWRVAFALQADGWWLRSDIIWAKPNPMPESVRDRPTRSHEHVFLLTKNARYFYDAEAIAESGVTAEKENYPAQARVTGRGTQGAAAARGNDRDKTGGFPPRMMDKQRGHSRRHAGFNDRWDAMSKDEQCGYLRNRRDVWFIATQPFKGAHFATFPEKLVEPCILAGSKPGDLTMDPFCGSGTTGAVARRLGRRFVGIDLNWPYLQLARERIGAVPIGMAM